MSLVPYWSAEDATKAEAKRFADIARDLEQSFGFSGIISGTAWCVNTRRSLTHSLDLGEEGLAVQATQKHASVLPAALFDLPPPAPPHLDGPSSQIADLAAGTAAEHLACADLLLLGYRAFLADQNCPYDVAVDLGGRLIRLQVKSTRAAKAVPQRASYTPAYQWNVRRAGKGGRRVYGANEFDLLALVALDVKRIAYLPPSQHSQTIHLRPPGSPPRPPGKGGKDFEDYPFDRAMREWLGAP